jgi:transcriptional regulator with XRE-family HTH domain
LDDLTLRVNGLAGLGPRRRAAGYTQQRIADELGVERARYGMWESCAVWPSAQWLPKLAKLLGCGIVDLYLAPENPSPAARELPLQGSQEPRDSIPRAEG